VSVMLADASPVSVDNRGSGLQLVRGLRCKRCVLFATVFRTRGDFLLLMWHCGKSLVKTHVWGIASVIQGGNRGGAVVGVR
jgi:hypothetical protein